MLAVSVPLGYLWGALPANRTPEPKLLTDRTSTLYVKGLTAIRNGDLQVVTLLDRDRERLLLHIFAMDQKDVLHSAGEWLHPGEEFPLVGVAA